MIVSAAEQSKPGNNAALGTESDVKCLGTLPGKKKANNVAVPCSTERASCAHTLTRFITGKGDVELTVFRKTESFPYCLGELLVAC